MKSIPTLFRAVPIVLGLAIAALCHIPDAFAQAPFQITSPPAGSVLAPGQPVTVLWTGGDPAWTVHVLLIEVTPGLPFAQAGTVASMPNLGTVTWTFPTSLPFDGPCGHSYQFYVEEATQITWTYGPHFTVACGIAVAIDVKPGRFPNKINPRHGVVRVAILGTATFDVSTVDAATVRFGAKSAAPLRSAIKDVNADGMPDLVLAFRTAETGIQCGDTAASLSGLTNSGQTLKGTDSIQTVGCPQPAEEDDEEEEASESDHDSHRRGHGAGDNR
jgi:hypothetical protein